jgi:hypothetical protein
MEPSLVWIKTPFEVGTTSHGMSHGYDPSERTVGFVSTHGRGMSHDDLSVLAEMHYEQK